MLEKLNLYKNNRRRGQMIVETMVAVTLLSIGLLGLFALLTQAYAMQQRMISRYTAAYLAAEGMEMVKNQIDTNVIQKRPWNTGYEVNGDYGIDIFDGGFDPGLATQPLLFDETSGIYNYQVGDVTSYTRIISVTNVTANELRIVSKVTWSDKNGKPAEIALEDHFYNWR